jgi:Spondin_N
MTILAIKKQEFYENENMSLNKYSITIIAFSILIVACKKEQNQINKFSEARYSIEITGKWAIPDFTVPAGVHFTNFTGLVHKNNTSLWQENMLASTGIENVAETGNTSKLLLEIDSIIREKKAISLIYFTPPGPVSIKMASVYCNSDFSFISFISMIAPSPDWFIGVSNFNLYKNEQWVNDTLIPLYVHDAGTEDGDIFGYNNPSTSPQQPIKLLTKENGSVLANGNEYLKPIAILRLKKF